MNHWRRWTSWAGCAGAIALQGMLAPSAHASFSVAVDLYIQDRQDYDDDVWVDFVPEDDAWVALYAVYSDGSVVPVYPTWNQRGSWGRCYGPQSIRVDVPRGLYLESVEAYASYDWFDPWGYYDACRPRYVGSPWLRPCEVAIVHSYPVSAWSFSFQWYSGWNDRCDRHVHGSPGRRIFAVAGRDFSDWKRKSHSGRRDFYRTRHDRYRQVVNHDVVRDRRRDERSVDRSDRLSRGETFVRADRDDSKRRVERSIDRSRDSKVRADRNRRDDGRVERSERRFASGEVRDQTRAQGDRVRSTNRVERRGEQIENRRERVEPRRERAQDRRERVEPQRGRAQDRRERVEPRQERVERNERMEQRRFADASRGRSTTKRSESIRRSESNRRESASYDRKSSGGGKQKSHSGQNSSKSRRVSGEPKGRSRS